MRLSFLLEQFWITGNDHVSFATKKEYEGRVTNSCYETKGKKSCTLRITDLKESDSAVYKFRFITNLPSGSYTGKPGIQLSVTGLKDSSYSILTLKCSSSCRLPSKSAYVWNKNGQKIDHDKSTFSINSDSLDSISCAVKGHEDFPAPYYVNAPVSPSLSADPSADIFEGSSVTLRCSSEANPPANYTWYKKTKTSTLQPLSRGSEFLLNNIQSSDSGEYYCEAENQLGKRSTNLNVDVKCKRKRNKMKERGDRKETMTKHFQSASSPVTRCKKNSTTERHSTRHTIKQHLETFAEVVLFSLTCTLCYLKI
uniref:B-cell receptor CD22 n=1 Tax=Cyprinodon variegatus TaxID=28743 RepID=A0A3Q2CB09_CYPVA